MREPARRFPMFQEVLRRGRLLERMLSSLGISAGAAARERHGDAIIEARATCIACPHTRECELWLDHNLAGSAPKDDLLPSRFCPNASYLAKCLDHAATEKGGPR